MSEGERPLADTMGKFAKVVVDGHKVPDVEWVSGRILLSTRRLLLVTNDGKATIPLTQIQSIRGRQDVNETLAQVSGYISIQTGSDVTLLSPKDLESFESQLFNAILDKQVIFAKHPAVKGGVVQNESWQKGRITIEDGTVALALGSGRFVEIEIDDVGTVDEYDGAVQGTERPIVEVEHTEEGTAVETHVSGTRRHAKVLASLLRQGAEQNTASGVELTDAESEVLMALYSGVSPFQIPEFVGMDVDRVEEIYDQLIEQGILEEIRVRRDVSLKARGRSIASDAMGEE